MTPKIVLITGCSSGIGFLTASQLAAKGHVVYATMRDLAKQEPLRKQASQCEGNLHILRLDVTDEASITQVIQEIEKDYGYLDVLINNAGYGIGGAFEDLQDAEIREIFETNFFGTQRMIRLSMPLLRKAKAAKIINLSSIAGLIGVPTLGAYCTSKFALEGFSESLRLELMQFGIYVTLIEPGSYQTNIWTKNIRVAERQGDPDSPYTEYSQKLLSAVDKRYRWMGDPNQVSRLICRVVEKKKPAMRYRLGIDAHFTYLLRRFLPFDTYAWILDRALKF